MSDFILSVIEGLLISIIVLVSCFVVMAFIIGFIILCLKFALWFGGLLL